VRLLKWAKSLNFDWRVQLLANNVDFESRLSLAFLAKSAVIAAIQNHRTNFYVGRATNLAVFDCSDDLILLLNNFVGD